MPGVIKQQASESYASFLATISDRPEAFLHPTDALHASSIVVSKRLIDPLAKSNSVIDQVYTEGMHIDQIWEQIKIITENVVEDILEMELPETINASDLQNVDEEDVEGMVDEQPYVDSETGHSDTDIPDMEYDSESLEASADGDELISHESDEEVLSDDLVDLPADADFLGDEDDEHQESMVEQPNAPFEKDVFGLNDQFFNIEEFNRQTELMDANYAQEQSDDEVDYNADPDEAVDEDDLEQEVEDDDNANEIRYNDFFAPPKRSGKQANSVKRKRARFDDDDDEVVDDDQESLHESSVDENENQTIARMQKDLFADDGEESDAEVASGPKLSAHAKRQLRLADEIRQLENDNISKKDWTLMGEASARARPKDSLLEEGLDFERTSKPVPIVTEEVTQTLEDMIKARIVEGRFDTVVRKIPESVHKFTKNSFELDENKPSQSLAEVYETEFQKKQHPGEFKTAKELQVEKEHKEIEVLFKDICYNLDSLSSWHYTPKPVTESLNIVTNAPAIEMEDAQPLTMSSASRLAPQEQFKTIAEKGEVAGKSGMPQSKVEMTSEEKQRHRRKQRAVAKKSGAQKRTIVANMSRSKQEQAGVIDTLKKANVSVIRNGKTRDLKSGKEYNGGTATIKPSNLKL
ncbi:U3 small nucleolar ribonucleoprotein mpp10 [Taphrina deformans PYCC 5710]|uniref:U3 small nucleolar ribonucleoprotein protein MPP10 n=1 Tax=Taphrina deformans (strain PYCC 5710 / ATCC 11124 / CBS 356.35 / IMI 108563 / JCM 9778 / NBRC 8474) TaxID=1097556 RepID=R4XGJ3_TAPDE|nr:U3 small nucleolar ribonucleoprotein mpp10 [Taphrina deformans PYCC 5710]|eukprot:CCG82489.1 U3 small nucleolar ribonucleoprotein mpp10 [Taphrina deformans PYCC 5710]